MPIRKNLNRLWMVFFCFFSFNLSESFASNYDSQIKQKQRELKRLKLELQDQRRKLKMVEVQEKGLYFTLTLTQKEINTTQKFLKSLNESAKILGQSMNQLEKQIDSLDDRIHRQKEKMGERVRALYTQGKPTTAEYLMKASQEINFSKRWTYLKKLVQYDADLVRRISELKQLRESNLQLLEEQKVKKNNIRLAKSHEAKELKKRQLEHQENLVRIKSNKNLFQKQVSERIAAQERTEKLINGLVMEKIKEKKRQEQLAAEAKKRAIAKKKYNKGDICWPVKGQLISKFGRQRDSYLKTYTTNLGVEIKAPEGNAVKAAASGEVLGILMLPEKGKGIIIDHHNDYLSVYAFLKDVRVREGQEVKTCETIASVSDEGALDGPKLFFQLKKNRQNLDPMNWLKHAR